MKPKTKTLRITEIFYSIQGESTKTGLPSIFIRLTGCPLRCQYCDTSYAFSGGQMMAHEEIFKEIKEFHCQNICITGGEPLAQPGCIELMQALCDLDYQVSLETSGAMDISQVDPRVMMVMDIKTPDSKESEKNLWSNLKSIKKTDQIKFVICSHEDYLWSKKIIEAHRLDQKTQLLFSPSCPELNPTDLANWILQDQLPVRFQIQLHKILWNDAPGH